MVGSSTQPATDATADNEMDVDYSSMDIDEPVDDDFMAINEPGSLSSSTLWESLHTHVPAEPNFAASKPLRNSKGFPPRTRARKGLSVSNPAFPTQAVPRFDWDISSTPRSGRSKSLAVEEKVGREKGRPRSKKLKNEPYHRSTVVWEAAEPR
ncbi:hypothetical protein BYT27DRAFT_7253219 [Phlegmacium glaucopus]|nr:hypothetical protein BYT27DRAFT_7253219 [Phlegmacium glaucopus]